ncbi:CPBP family intramembrane glutamic endopeptidase [Convivina intestini]|uniref:CPBP family intramembrane glutamic endopeptidase n=1 Tax=Convivina intestini TaxID=1505726 RepID=UPI000B7EA1DF
MNEELLDRGIVLATLLILFKNSSNPKAQLLWPIIISSLIFGLSHFMNLSRQDPLSTLFQVTSVSGIGFLLDFIYLRTHNIF